MDIEKLDQYTTAMFKEMQEARDAAIGVGAYADAAHYRRFERSYYRQLDLLNEIREGNGLPRL